MENQNMRRGKVDRRELPFVEPPSRRMNDDNNNNNNNNKTYLGTPVFHQGQSQAACPPIFFQQEARAERLTARQELVEITQTRRREGDAAGRRLGTRTLCEERRRPFSCAASSKGRCHCG
jgi:hypothetical protein